MITLKLVLPLGYSLSFIFAFPPPCSDGFRRKMDFHEMLANFPFTSKR